VTHLLLHLVLLLMLLPGVVSGLWAACCGWLLCIEQAAHPCHHV